MKMAMQNDRWERFFREIFYTQFLAELKQRGKTILVISHNDHFSHLADRMIKLDYSRIESDDYPVAPKQKERSQML